MGREGDSMRIAVSADRSDDTPGLTLRVYAPASRPAHGPITLGRPVKVTDLTLNGTLNARVAL